MTNKQTFNQQEPPAELITNAIRDAENILVVSHIDPDGDALGSLLAMQTYLKSLGKTVIVSYEGEIPDKYRFMKGINKIPQAESIDENTKLDAAIILECPNYRRVGYVSRFLLKDNIVIVNIDHHRDNDEYGHLNWFNPEASSVGEMVYEYFESVKYNIAADTAEQLYVAIMTDTGRFRYSSTSPRTFEITAKLVEAGADPNKACDFVYYDLKPSSMILIGKVLNTIDFHFDGELCMLRMTDKMLSDSGADYSESDGLVDYTLFNRGVTVGVFIKETDKGNIKVSLRSKDGINVAAIAAEYGGGGHFNASGFVVDGTIKKVKEMLCKRICYELFDKKEK